MSSAQPLLKLSGSIVSIGDMPEDEVPPLAGVPHILLRTDDGQNVVISGLTRDQCKACVPAFLSAASLAVSES